MPYVLLTATRTPLGSLGGSLRAATAPALGGAVLTAALAGFDPAGVDLCVLGMALAAGTGPGPAQAAARAAGVAAPALAVHQGRLSGLAAIWIAAQAPVALALAGGMDSASQAPYLLPGARWGTRFGETQVLDSLDLDGIWTAGPAGTLAPGADLTGGEDDPPAAGVEPGDGAAAVLLGTEASSLEPLGRIRTGAWGPDARTAAERALAQAGLTLGDLDRLEVDPAAAFPGLPVNLRGEPPVLAPGAEGARRLVSLAHQLRDEHLRLGLVALEADGAGLALILERA